MEPVRYEWDEAKRVENLERHGIDFYAIGRFDWDVAIIVTDNRRAYGEERLVAYAPMDGRVHVLVYTRRSEFRRLISFRKANRREQAAYSKAILARLAGG